MEALFHLEELSGQHGLRNVDLRLATHQVDFHATADGLAISSREEHVANNGAVGERLVRNGVGLIEGGIGQGDQELTSGVRVEVLSSVPFDPLLIPDLRLLCLGVNLGNQFVKVG